MEALRELVEVIRDLYLRGWLPATSGNFSLRMDEDSVFITPSGKHKGKLTERDFALVDLEGNLKDGQKKPSAETLLHLTIYSMVPSARCVMHVHSPNATVISRLVNDKVPLKGYELLKAFGLDTHEGEVVIPVFENSQDMPFLAKKLKDYLFEHPDTVGFLLKSHGVYIWGEQVSQALMRLEALEFLFECELKLAIISGK